MYNGKITQQIFISDANKINKYKRKKKLIQKKNFQ